MWIHNVVLFLFTLTSPRSHSGSVTDGKTREEEPATGPGTRQRRQPGDDIGEIPICCATTTTAAGSIGSGA